VSESKAAKREENVFIFFVWKEGFNEGWIQEVIPDRCPSEVDSGELPKPKADATQVLDALWTDF
jgi:hypothetical protein